MKINIHLHKKIEITRVRMITIGLSEGLSSPNTVKISQYLDKLLNIQTRLTIKSRNYAKYSSNKF